MIVTQKKQFEEILKFLGPGKKSFYNRLRGLRYDLQDRRRRGSARDEEESGGKRENKSQDIVYLMLHA